MVGLLVSFDLVGKVGEVCLFLQTDVFVHVGRFTNRIFDETFASIIYNL